jgi:outer membrane protein assembly factor BamB
MAWQVKCIPVISDGVIYINAWEGGSHRTIPAFNEALSQYDSNGDGALSPQESPDSRIRAQGAWRELDLDQDGVMGRRDWKFLRSRYSPENSLVAIRPGNALGDLTESHVLWRYQKALPNTSSPLLINNVLFIVKDGGIVTSLDPSTGRVLKQARLEEAIGKYWASPVGAGDKVYLVSEAGDVTTLRAKGNWEELATDRLQEDCLATPAIVGDRIYLRTLENLYCFGKGPYLKN